VQKKKRYSKGFFVFFVLTSLVFSAAALYLYIKGYSSEDVRSFIYSFGALAPAVFIIICTIKPAIFFLPSLGLTIVAGTLFGPLYGTLYVAIGGAGSTVIGFYMARKLGRKSIERLLKDNERLRKIDELMGRSGFKTILFMRAVNLPWDMVSYSAGLSGISFKDFYLGSLLLLVPTSFIYTYFGSTIWKPRSPEFFISLAVIGLVGSIPFVLERLKKFTHAVK